ncbi:MAG: nickel pincer cofactor biosynthesis protein LarC [Acidobacteria bacterium]|nr:MAG: nickel pincer cofactor biosynthesis protein LarC [Acidobacteriota bacterium]
MKRAYLDGSSGISGDMFLGALVDAGISAQQLLAELKKIPLGFYELKRTRAVRGGLVGTRLEVKVPAQGSHRHLAEIETLIKGSGLSESVQAKARAIFHRLAEAEGKLHGKPPSEVHFHEVGAVDAIVDIVGASIGLELAGIGELFSSPLNVGGGRVEAAHGTLPVPAPATAELLKGVPVYSSGVEGELVTPTGAAIVSTLAKTFGPMPAMKVEQIGYGAGAMDFHGHPNVARIFIGEAADAETAHTGLPGDELVSVIEANLDDMSPQLYGYLVERALAKGALDVTCTAVQMKKGRPGIQVTVLSEPDKGDELAGLLFDETTTIGLRIYEARRKVLERESAEVETPYGRVRMKVAKCNGRVLNVAPEYDDCQRVAREKSVPLKEVMLAAQSAYRQKIG